MLLCSAYCGIVFHATMAVANHWELLPSTLSDRGGPIFLLSLL